jgi:hypothetical protein
VAIILNSLLQCLHIIPQEFCREFLTKIVYYSAAQ